MVELECKNTGRHVCLIFGCKRTRVINRDYVEWICSKHWRAVPKKYRKLYTMAKRKFKYGQITESRLVSIWEKCKKQAFINAWSAI